MGKPIHLTQAHFGWYLDGTESASTPTQVEDANDTIDCNGAGNVHRHIRISLQETNAGTGASTDDYTLYYKKNGAGSYIAVTAERTDVVPYAGTLTDQEATTNRSTNGLTDGTGSFVASKCDEANGIVTDWAMTASNFTEMLWSIDFIKSGVADNDYFDFEVYLNGGIITAYIFQQMHEPPSKRLILRLTTFHNLSRCKQGLMLGKKIWKISNAQEK